MGSMDRNDENKENMYGFHNIDDETLDNISLDNQECVDILVDTLLAESTALPRRVSKIRDFRYDFSPFRLIDSKKNELATYETYVNCVDIDGFLYPLSIFNGKIEYTLDDKCINFFLKKDYKRISDIFGRIESHPIEYFNHGKVPSFNDFVVRKQIIISGHKGLKMIITRCSGRKFISEGVNIPSIVDFDEELLPGVVIEAVDSTVGRSFVLHRVKIDFENNRAEYLKKYLVNEEGKLVPCYYDFTFSVDLSLLPKIIPYCNEYPLSDITPLTLSRNFSKMFVAVDWNGLAHRSIKFEKELEDKFDTKTIKKESEYRYTMYIDGANPKENRTTTIRFTSYNLKMFSPFNDGGGSFINQLLLLRQNKATLIDILNKNGIKYNDEREKSHKYE